MFNYSKCILIILVLSLLPACGARYKINPLKPLSKTSEEKIDYRETKNNVTVSAKKLNEDDCMYLFNNNVLAETTVQPIQIAVENKTDAPLKIKAIQLERLTKEEIETLLYSYCTKPSRWYWGIPVCTLAGTAGISLTFLSLNSFPGIALGFYTLWVGGFIALPLSIGIATGMYAYDCHLLYCNKENIQSFLNKNCTFKKSIGKDKEKDFLIFTKQSLDSPFAMSVVSEKTNEETRFTISL